MATPFSGKGPSLATVERRGYGANPDASPRTRSEAVPWRRDGLRDPEIELPSVHRDASSLGLGVGGRLSSGGANRWSPTLSRCASRGCPVLKRGSADEEDEP